MEDAQPPGPVLCYGMLGVDQIVQVAGYPERDGHTRILSDQDYIGGGAANTAVNLSCLGVPVKLMGTTLGEDRRGRFFLQAIRDYPVDVADLDVAPGIRTGYRVVLSGSDGSRTQCGHFPDLRSRVFPAEAAAGAALLVVDPFLGQRAVDAARMGRKAGVSVFGTALLGEHPLAEHCDVVVNSSGFLRRHRVDSPSDVAVALLKAGVETVVITRGQDGCSVYRETGRSFDLPAYSVPVRETSGAGDAFRAGLIYGYLQGWTLTRGLQFAGGCAGLTCGAVGSCGHVQSANEVLQLITDT